MESKIFVPDEGNYFKIHIMTYPFPSEEVTELVDSKYCR